MKEYVGHESQLYGVEEHKLCGGKGDGIRLFEVNNGRGLMFTISADRCGDISRLYFNGKNMGYFAPCGYVSPKYYDDKGAGFLKSFTAGFLTTCGLTAVGDPCTDNGEDLPLHGTIGNTPAENVNCFTDDKGIHVKLYIRDASLFGHQLILEREYVCPLDSDEIIINDKVKNISDRETPYMILYHFNMGYPLLSEKSVLTIKNNGVTPRNADAEKGIKDALIVEKPTSGFVEQCFYYDMVEGKAEIYNPDIKTSLSINYNKNELPFFTEWKMMGKGEYVLGLEPGNCTPDGRDVMRKNNTLAFLKPGEEASQQIVIRLKNE
ncbi:MAG: aldose 1-epimerase family protein [Clostridia bacterium]|nr:aldose 1-epimerase family protein [Clostridia bacterium]